MYQVGLFKVGGHFSQNLLIGYPDIYRKAKAVPYLVFDGFRSLLRGGVAVFYGGKIHKAFVYAELFNFRADIGQKMHEFPAFPVIKRMVGGFYYKGRTFSERVYNGLACDDAIFFCRNGFGKHHAVAAFHVASYDGGNRAQINTVAVFKLF